MANKPKRLDEVPLAERVDPGSYRKRIYDYLEAEGFKITDERHKLLSFLIKANANSLNEVYAKKITQGNDKLQHRERAAGWRTKAMAPILCKTKEEHEARACYYDCKI